jgi:predicted ATP-grasp superfamily ATP-dependent carboligase
LEYITAGGLSNKRLPPSLLCEAKLMRDALLADLSDISGIEIVTTYDARLPIDSSLLSRVQATCIDSNKDAMTIWQALLPGCDAALVVAPETEQLLSSLTNMLAAAGVRNLACTQSAVDLASNKYDTCRLLQAANILTIPTYRVSEFLQADRPHNLPAGSAYVLKPIDGAGCSDTLYFTDAAALNSYLNREAGQDDNTAARLANNAQPSSAQSDQIIQPYEKGTPASMTLLCKQGQAWLLSCNLQYIVINQEQNPPSIEYRGGQVNALAQHQAAFAQLAQAIAAAMPGLNGYVGVDLIIEGAHIYVVEINPRITTSYIGLRESLGCNPMQLLLDLDRATDFILPESIGSKPVDISLYA